MKRSNAICKWNGRENAGVVGIFTGWMLAFQLADRRATFFSVRNKNGKLA